MAVTSWTTTNIKDVFEKQEKEKQDILKEILDYQKNSIYRYKFKKSHRIKKDKR